MDKTVSDFFSKYSAVLSTVAIIISVGSLGFQIISNINQNEKDDYRIWVENKPLLEADSITFDGKVFDFRIGEEMGFFTMCQIHVSNNSENNVNITYFANLPGFDTINLRDQLLNKNQFIVTNTLNEQFNTEIKANTSRLFDYPIFISTLFDTLYMQFILVCENEYGGVYDVYQRFKIDCKSFLDSNIIYKDDTRLHKQPNLTIYPSLKKTFTSEEKDNFYEYLSKIEDYRREKDN